MSTEFDAGDAASDSEISDIQDVVVADPASRASSVANEVPTYTEADPDASDLENQNETDSAEDNNSDDGDFDMDDNPPSPQSDAVDDVDDAGSSSQASRRIAKRKVAVEEDYIHQNPELYGLRRSGRATQARRFVDSDSSSESDVVPTSRRPQKKRRVETSQPSSKRATPARQPSASDSDSDNYGGARAKTFRRKARRQREEQPDQVLAEKRWSSRRAAQVQQGMYQESSAEEEEEASADNNDYLEEYVDTRPYIEKVVRHRPKVGTEIDYSARRDDFEYYIKWQGQSHLHDTWEEIDDLKEYRGYRKVENYFRKTVEFELHLKYSDDIPPESKEQYLLDRERDEEALEDYTKVERIVAVRNGEHGTEYFVKWKGLAYDECTWEAELDISPEFQDKIDQYLNRSVRSWGSDRKEASVNTRTRMTKLEEQPSYIKGGELRQFQLLGLNFLCLNWTRGNNVILADEMGLGKTVQSVSFLSWLRNDRLQEGPFLVVAPLSVIPAWCDTFNNWAPDLNYVVYLGPDSARRIIRDNELLVDGNPKKPKFNVLVTSYDYILADWQFLQTIKWQVLAVDEAHRLKNRESQLYAKLFNFGVPCKVLITGTPIQNNLEELAALLDFLNPGKVQIEGDLESLSADDAQVQLENLHKAISPYILRRTKETVESDLPPKTEKIIRVELSDVQLEYYKNVLTRNYSALRDANGQKASLLNIMMELKKISNHPYMFPGVEDRVLAGSTRREDQIKGLITSSGKMMLLDQLLTKLKRDNHRVLIFSQMVRMLDILSDYLSFRGYKFQRLDGTIAAAPRRMAINHFNAEDSEDFCFLLSTRAGGLGINLMTADTVIIFDSDWNPQADLQAMARAHRIGQKKPVNIYRLVSKETVEEEVLERARNKLLLEYLTIQAGVTDEGKAFREQFNKKGLKVDGPSSSEDIQWVLKMRSQKMFEQTGNQERLEQLDIDTILENAEVTKTKVDDKINLSSGGIDWDNFMQYTDVKVDDIALDWDEIIPAERLEEIKAEEDVKKQEEYIAKLAEENAPRRAAMKSRNMESDRADRLAKKRERQMKKEQEVAAHRASLRDPKRPLTEKEQRNLIRAFQRFGCMDERADEIAEDARLADRDRGFLKQFITDFINACEKAIEDNNAKLAQVEKEMSRAVAKKDKKAVLFDFADLKKVNAETPLERPPQLRLLRKTVKTHGDWRTFRLPEASKAAHYSCPWGAREDAMLLVGIDRHGFGAWGQIRDDPALEMGDKLFLEEHRIEKKTERDKVGDKKMKAPGAVHLTRRTEYLLSVLQAKYTDDVSAQRAVDGHHRVKKQALSNGHRASPAPGMARKGSYQRDRDFEHRRSHSMTDDRDTPRSELKRKHSQKLEHERDRSAKSRRAEDPRRARGYDDEGSPRSDKRKRRDDRDDRATLKHRRVEDSSRRYSDDPRRRDDRDRPSDERRRHEHRPKEQDGAGEDQRSKALSRLAHLRRLGDHPEARNTDEDAMLWYLLKPVRNNFECILSTTKESVKSNKERASIFGRELVAIGDFLSEKSKADNLPQYIVDRFWDFLGNLWPIESTKGGAIDGTKLSTMYKKLLASKQAREAQGGSGAVIPRANGASSSVSKAEA